MHLARTGFDIDGELGSEINDFGFGSLHGEADPFRRHIGRQTSAAQNDTVFTHHTKTGWRLDIDHHAAAELHMQ